MRALTRRLSTQGLNLSQFNRVRWLRRCNSFIHRRTISRRATNRITVTRDAVIIGVPLTT